MEQLQNTNGVDKSRFDEMISAVQVSPELARFRFEIENRWINAGETRSQVKPFYGCRQNVPHKKDFRLSSDEPDVLLGSDEAPNPVEHLLHALAACVTTSMVYHAAARGITVDQVESSLDGDLDLRGFLGLDPSVRNGYQQIRLKLRIRADASDEQLRELSSFGPMFSPVYDSIVNGVPVAMSVERIR